MEMRDEQVRLRRRRVSRAHTTQEVSTTFLSYDLNMSLPLSKWNQMKIKNTTRLIIIFSIVNTRQQVPPLRVGYENGQSIRPKQGGIRAILHDRKTFAIQVAGHFIGLFTRKKDVSTTSDDKMLFQGPNKNKSKGQSGTDRSHETPRDDWIKTIPSFSLKKK